MPARHRLMIWLDNVGMPTTVALARYEDEDRLWEKVWETGPFDTPDEALAALMAEVDIQQTLWDAAPTSGRRHEGAPGLLGAPSSSSASVPPADLVDLQMSGWDEPLLEPDEGPGDDSAP